MHANEGTEAQEHAEQKKRGRPRKEFGAAAQQKEGVSEVAATASQRKRDLLERFDYLMVHLPPGSMMEEARRIWAELRPEFPMD